MRYEFDRVIDGLSRYIDAEIYAGMNNWQEMLARIFIGRIIGNEAELKEKIVGNGFIRTFGIVDSEGMIDVESLAKDLKRELSRKGEMSFNIPMFGKLTFKPTDVDVLYRHITGEELQYNETH